MTLRNLVQPAGYLKATKFVALALILSVLSCGIHMERHTTVMPVNAIPILHTIDMDTKYCSHSPAYDFISHKRIHQYNGQHIRRTIKPFKMFMNIVHAVQGLSIYAIHVKLLQVCFFVEIIITSLFCFTASKLQAGKDTQLNSFCLSPFLIIIIN